MHLNQRSLAGGINNGLITFKNKPMLFELFLLISDCNLFSVNELTYLQIMI